MAEFCIDCLNEGLKKKFEEKDFILSKDLWFCEGCGQMKHIVLIERKAYFRYKFRFILIPLRFLLRLIFLPYLVYKELKKPKN